MIYFDNAIFIYWFQHSSEFTWELQQHEDTVWTREKIGYSVTLSCCAEKDSESVGTVLTLRGITAEDEDLLLPALPETV